MVKFELNDEQAKKLEQAMTTIQTNSEKVVNEVLETKGTKLMIQKIVGFINESPLKKKHAKSSNPLKHTMLNLGFEIKPKPRFGYLVFPNSGIGKRNKKAQKFFERGAESANELILQELLTAIEQEHTRIIGG